MSTHASINDTVQNAKSACDKVKPSKHIFVYYTLKYRCSYYSFTFEKTALSHPEIKQNKCILDEIFFKAIITSFVIPNFSIILQEQKFFSPD